MTPRACDLLRETKAVLGQHGENWTQGYYGKSADGYDVSPLSQDAVDFCLVGALARAAGPTLIDPDYFEDTNSWDGPAAEAFAFLAQATTVRSGYAGGCPESYNDSAGSFKAISGLLDDAIDRCLAAAKEAA